MSYPMLSIFALSCALTFPGCAGKSTPETAPAAALPDGVWHLVSYGPLDAPVDALPGANAIITVDQANGQLSGTAGCNHFSGELRVSGADVGIGPLAATKKMCPEPTGIMAQENAVLGALSDVTRFTIDGDVLTLYYGEERGLRFTSSPVAATESIQPLAFLQRHAGQYPRDSMLWDDPALLPRLTRLLGDDLALFLANIQVQGPLRQDGGVYFVTGNKPHEGGRDVAAFVADPGRDQIQVWLAVGGKSRTYTEKKPALPYPAEVATFVANLENAP